MSSEEAETIDTVVSVSALASELDTSGEGRARSFVEEGRAEVNRVRETESLDTAVVAVRAPESVRHCTCSKGARHWAAVGARPETAAVVQNAIPEEFPVVVWEGDMPGLVPKTVVEGTSGTGNSSGLHCYESPSQMTAERIRKVQASAKEGVQILKRSACEILGIQIQTVQDMARTLMVLGLQKEEDRRTKELEWTIQGQTQTTRTVSRISARCSRSHGVGETQKEASKT